MVKQNVKANKPSASAEKVSTSQIKIMSWNIQSSNSVDGSKFEDPDFVKFLDDHSIICLQEIRQATKLCGYRSFSTLREGEKSGGVGLIYKNEFKSGIEIVKKYKLNDVIICRLKKSFFRLTHDIFVVNAYITPQNSSGKQKIDGRELLAKISDVINELREKGKVILCGDFNSRIADHPGLVQFDETDEHIHLPDDYIPDSFSTRCSQDKQTNSYGRDFLSLVMNNNLTILNGRTLGDLSGKLTCIHPRGCSVIDYFAIASSAFPSVSLMEILPFTHFSDHRPLSLTLRTNQFSVVALKPLEESHDPAPAKFLFNEHSKYEFIDVQSQDQFQTKLNTLSAQIPLPIGDESSILSRPTVQKINDEYTKYLREMTELCSKKTKVNPKKRKNKPWYKWGSAEGKRAMKRAERATTNHPKSDFIRTKFYEVKKAYRSLCNRLKNEFYSKLNKDIENGNILNWKQFKRLKTHKSDKLNFDSLDMDNFEQFFSNLYADNHKTIDLTTKASLLSMADTINRTANTPPDLDASLNSEITIEEVKTTISSLKSGKASSKDMIANEILKTLNRHNVTFLTDLFNACFEAGVYPWNANIITPLHKKGSKDDPDNYRAVAVSSVIGKLFSTILLERFIKFRNEKCPDPPNQLGFTKGAQTYDHIFTMQTISAKYKKRGKPVYAIFVDFRKAFDSVCRQALFFKLAQSGATGKFYNVLRDMYANSYGYIKLSGHLSKRFDIKKGTEQGHPLSPDLFKHFLSDLSPLLEFANCPILADLLISHLLWADDLILISLDKQTAQNQLNRLNAFCEKWGLEVNILKTKTMVMGKESSDSSSPKFFLGNKELDVVDEYCYLGIILHKSGSCKEAKNSLKTKAMRAFFGLKRTVVRPKLSFRALSTLFDSLIKPIVLYGAPIWLPTSSIIKNLTSACNSQPQSLSKITSKLCSTPCEKVHLSFLRWALGVHRKSSTIGIWGETGRYPLVYQSIKLTLNYYKRLARMKAGTLVHAALQEQQKLNLPWFRNIEPLLQIDELYYQDHVTAFQTLKRRKNPGPKNNLSQASINLTEQLSHLRKSTPLPSKKFRVEHILKRLKDHFKDSWNHEKSKSTKLSLFYDSVKSNFIKEPYLDYVKNASFRYRTTRLRISAHDLEIETGRYKNIPRENRSCKWCNLTLGTNVIENENHMLFNCDLYSNLRNKLVNTLHKTPFKDDQKTLIDSFNSIQLSSLHDTFTKLQSPPELSLLESDTEETDSMYNHFLVITNTSTTTSHTHPTKNVKTTQPIDFEHATKIRSYIHNALASFVSRCFDKRWAFLDEQKKQQSGDLALPTTANSKKKKPAKKKPAKQKTSRAANSKKKTTLY